MRHCTQLLSGYESLKSLLNDKARSEVMKENDIAKDKWQEKKIKERILTDDTYMYLVLTKGG